MASRCDKPFLPFEIIINIVKRLPIKSIVRFQCVCKEWKNLFKAPSFIAEHLHHSDRKNPFLLLHEWAYERRGFMYTDEHWSNSLRLLDHKMETIEVLSIPSIGSFGDRLEIIGSCNGLLCVQVGQVKFYSQELYDNTIIDGVEVYSLSTGSWKELEFGALHISAALSKAVNVDGTIFWLDDPVVLSFDIATEVATLTQLPTEDALCPIGLGVYENKLVGHYGFIEEDRSHSVCVWVMEEVASESGKSLSCTQKYRIHQGSLFLARNLSFWRNEMVCPHTKYITDEEGDAKCILHMFNLNTNEGRKFNCSTSYDWCDVFNYEKSLVSVWNNQVV
ncbi:hypothetical protein K1719_028399 [Acacia pycnantha]|nr:hypothetical protein K1719_028399 [Acacia pycnantha]